MKTIHMPLVTIPSIIIDVPSPVEPGDTYSLTVVSADSSKGTVSGGGRYSSGSTATIKATPNAGCHFVQWNDGNTNATRTVTVNADATYTATFAVDTPTSYTLTVQSNDTSLGTVSGGGSYASGSSATLTATPKTGCHFVQWNDGNTNATRTVTVTQNKTYTATFAADTPSPSTPSDYRIGWFDGTSSEHAARTAATLEAGTTGYSKSSQPTYSHAAENKILCVLYKQGSEPASASLASGGITTSWSAIDLAGGDSTFNNAPHEPVTIDGTVYTVVSYRNNRMNIGSDLLTVNF